MSKNLTPNICIQKQHRWLLSSGYITSRKRRNYLYVIACCVSFQSCYQHTQSEGSERTLCMQTLACREPAFQTAPGLMCNLHVTSCLDWNKAMLCTFGSDENALMFVPCGEHVCVCVCAPENHRQAAGGQMTQS